jgi:transposase
MARMHACRRKLVATCEAPPHQLPDDIEALKRLLLEREAQLEIARHNERAHLTLIEHLKLQIAKLKRMQFGRSSEKLNAQIEQLELIVEDLEQEQASTAPEAPCRPRPRQQPGAPPAARAPAARDGAP